jgi:hypothetical protein
VLIGPSNFGFRCVNYIVISFHRGVRFLTRVQRQRS